MDLMTRKAVAPLPNGLLQRNREAIEKHLHEAGFSDVDVDEDNHEVIFSVPVSYPIGKLVTLGVEIGMLDAHQLHKETRVDVHG